MNTAVVDVETTILNKGNPFDYRNRLCYVGIFDGVTYDCYHLSDDPRVLKEQLSRIRNRLSSFDCLVGFNFKFDLHWLRRYGLTYANCDIWDCQLFEFIASNQTSPYPSLNESCLSRGLGSKLDIVATEYWDKGIDTPDIPVDIMLEYLRTDLLRTWELYQKQLESDYNETLIKLANQDLLVLQECEWNGMKYDLELSEKLGSEIEQRVRELSGKLGDVFGPIPINWASPQHVSACLYGGIVKAKVREPYEFRYKDGRVKIKERWVEKTFQMARLVEPLKGSELATDGYWSTSEETLRSLKPNRKAKEIINMILEISLLQTKIERYYFGIPKKYIEKGWQGSIIHGQLNQCVTRTGRLSSSDPNMQNMDGIAKQCFVSRF